MAVDYATLLNYPVPEIRHRYTWRDTVLYALGIGVGADPSDPRQLPFVYEQGLQACPTLPLVLGHPGFWWKRPDTGVDWVRVVHAEQEIVLHKPVPPEGEVLGRTRVTGIVDKGAGKGLLVHTERLVTDAATGDLIATLPSTTFLRGDGGIGAPAAVPRAVHRVPERAPDLVVTRATLAQSALLYRLSGDHNPLHADPRIARAAGYDRPILHGLCTLGAVAFSLGLEHDRGPRALAGLGARFTGPVFPGETLETDVWCDGPTWSFRTRVPSRNLVALDHGFVKWAA